MNVVEPTSEDPHCAGPLQRLKRRMRLLQGGHSCGRRASAAALRWLRFALPPIVGFCVLPGCRVLLGTTAVAVGAVGLVGYGVYKTGEVAVTGAGAAVVGVASGAHSVLFADGDFKATCDGTVEEVWRAGDRVLRTGGFRSVSGTRDALSGILLATTLNNEDITVKLESAAQGQTHVRVRIGADGNLNKSETLYNLIATQVAKAGRTQSQETL